MPNIIQLRRDTTANWDSVDPVLAEGEIGINLDTDQFKIGNGIDIWSDLTYFGGGGTWGSITGTLSNQTDLQNALNAKVPYTGATGNVTLGEYGLTTGYSQFDTTPTQAGGVGRLIWNDTDGTLDLGLKGGNVTLQVGQEQVVRVVNKTGSTLQESAYQVVKVSTAQGQRLGVALAQANNDNNSADTLGIVTETILNNQEGFITISGLVNNINTTGSLQGETWADGDVLYLSGTTPGAITNVKPSAPIHLVKVGYVVYAHANNGKIFVDVINGFELDELHDVKITSPTNGQVLIYNSTSGLWENGSAGGIGTVTSVALSAPTGFTVSGSPITTSGTLALTFASGYSLPTNTKQSNWDDAYTFVGNFPTQTGNNGKYLTTDGSSLSWGTINLSGYVPTSRTLTINGTSFDLSADRSWTISTGISIGTTVTSATTGSILFAGAGGVLSQNNSKLFWDNTNNRLGIGTATPAVPFDVVGNTSSTNTAQFGTIGIQSFSVNNAWFGDNVFFNGTNFVRRVTGSAGFFYFQGTEGQFRFAPSGNGGTLITNGVGSSGNGRIVAKINLDGTFAVGDVNLLSGNYTGSTFIVFGSTGNVGINTITDGGFRLDVNGTTRVQGALTVSTGGASITGNLTIVDNNNIVAGSTNGLKIGTATSQKIGFWNVTPIVQPTTAVAAATFVANTSAIANDTATFDGYTIGQIVKALRNIGILA